MTLSEINTQLTDILKQQQRKQYLEDSLRLVTQKLKDERGQRVALKAQLKKEAEDVYQIKGMTIISLRHFIQGTRQECLEKEEQELSAVQLKHKQLLRNITTLKKNHTIIQAELDTLDGLDSKLRKLMTQVDTYATTQPESPLNSALLKASAMINARYNAIDALEQSVSTAQTVATELDEIESALKNAYKWGDKDMVNKNMDAGRAKHGHLKNARRHIHDIQSKLDRLHHHLTIIQHIPKLEIDLTQFKTFAHIFPDTLMADLSVQNKIKEALTRTHNTQTAVSTLITTLQTRQQALAADIKTLQQKRITLVQQHSM